MSAALASLVDALEHAFYAEELAKKNGLLQKLDPRVKIVATSAAHRDRGPGAPSVGHCSALCHCSCGCSALECSAAHAGETSLDGSAYIHRRHFSSCLVPHSRPDALHSAAAWLDRHCARTARRRVSHHAGGDGCDFFSFAGAMHSLEQLAEGACACFGCRSCWW